MSAVTTLATPDMPRCPRRSVTSLLGGPVLLSPSSRVARRWSPCSFLLPADSRDLCAPPCDLRVQRRRNARAHEEGRIQCIKLRCVQNATSGRGEEVREKTYGRRVVGGGGRD